MAEDITNRLPAAGEALWAFAELPTEGLQVQPPEFQFPKLKIPAQPSPWAGWGLARLFGPLPAGAGPVAVIATITPGDTPIREPEEIALPQWRIGDLSPAIHQRLEAERRERSLQWLASEQAMAWVRGDFLRVNLLQNEIQSLTTLVNPLAAPIRMRRILNSANGIDGQGAGASGAPRIDEEKLRDLARPYGFVPQGVVMDFLQTALDGGPVAQAMLLRLPALGEQAGPLWPENAHLNILRFLAEHAKDSAARVYAITLIVREVAARIQHYRDYIKEGQGLTEGLRAQLDGVREAVAILMVIAQGHHDVASQKADDALRHLAYQARETATSGLISHLIQNPDLAARVVTTLVHPPTRAASHLRDIHRELLHEEPPPVDLPSALDESASPHHTLFSAPEDAEATLSMFWPAPFDQPALWDSLLRQWGDSGFIPTYYEPGAQLEPLVVHSELKTHYPLEPWDEEGTWGNPVWGQEPLDQLYRKVMGTDDPQYKVYASEHLIRESRRRPWPSQLLALSQIAIHNHELSQRIVTTLRQILLDCTVADHVRPSLAPGAAEAAFDGLMRIVNSADHFHAAVARRALMEVARHSPRVARRLKKVQWGKSGPVAVLRSSNPP